jgi:starch synthase (maltosyl-transferring)
MAALGFDWHERISVRDLLTGVEYEWGQHNAARLDPHAEPAHIFLVRPASNRPVPAGGTSMGAAR